MARMKMSTNRPTRLFLAPGLFLLAACGGEPAPQATVRDSAGVTIVENQAPAQPVYRVVDSTPILEIGGSGEVHDEFTRINGLAWMADGGVVVADGAVQELRIFGPDGVWRATAGRKGGGPGEFEGLNGIHVLADGSLLAFDSRHRRFSDFSVDGSFLGERPLEPGGPRFPQLLGRLADGRALFRAGGVFTPGGSQAGVSRPPAIVVLYDSAGALMDTVGEFPGSEAFVQLGGEGATRTISVGSLPLGRNTRFAVVGDRFVVAPSDDYELLIYRLDGTLERSIRRPFTKRSIKDADIERYLEDMADHGSRDFVNRMRKPLMEAARPEAMPAYSNLLVGDNGQLWVEDFTPPGIEGPVRWSVFEAGGQWLGEAEMPARFKPYRIAGGRVLGVWLDPDDVPFVRAYQLREP
jgi:hypothetical protein